MAPVDRRLAMAGLALFVFGLALGFGLKALPNPRAGLSAHLNAVQSGTFLIVLGLLWPRLAVWKAAAGPLGHAIWIAFWGLEAGMVLAAFVPAGAAVAVPKALKLAAAGLTGLSAITMFLSVGALIFTFRSASPAGGSLAAMTAERGELDLTR
jgi:(hydroxyamino)benzene mutase